MVFRVLGSVREGWVWGPGWGGRLLTGGKRPVVEQLRCSCACGLRGRLVAASQPSTHAGLQLGPASSQVGSWLSLGCCFSWPSGVQPCPQVSKPRTLLCASSGPKPTPHSGHPWRGRDAGRQDRDIWGPLRRVLPEAHYPLPHFTPPPSYLALGPQSCSLRSTMLGVVSPLE